MWQDVLALHHGLLVLPWLDHVPLAPVPDRGAFKWGSRSPGFPVELPSPKETLKSVINVFGLENPQMHTQRVPC